VKRIVIVAIVVAAIGFAAWRTRVTRAQAPTVASILEHYVNALGGREAIQRMTTRTAKGTFEATGMNAVGVAEAYAKTPNKYATLVQVPGVGESRHGFDGNSGWVSDNGGLRDMQGQELSSMRRASEFYESLKIAQLYTKLTLKGVENVAARPAYEIDADPGDGTLRRMFFDVESGLMVRTDEELDTPNGRESTLSYLEDFKDVEGVKHPFTVRQVRGEQTFTVHLTQILVNQPIDDAKFAKPKQ
jgi:zinc protease